MLFRGKKDHFTGKIVSIKLHFTGLVLQSIVKKIVFKDKVKHEKMTFQVLLLLSKCHSIYRNNGKLQNSRFSHVYR